MAPKGLLAIAFASLFACSASEADPAESAPADPVTNEASPRVSQTQETITYDSELTQGGFIRGWAPRSARKVTLGEE